MEKFDFHTHSDRSDGTLAPAALVAAAKEAGVKRLALTDHDCILGLGEAAEAGKRLGIRVIPGLEIDTEYPDKLHLLGLGIDPQNEALRVFAVRNVLRRKNRNSAMIEKLEQAGIHIRPYLRQGRGSSTRLHLALALVEGGYAKSVGAAFGDYLLQGKVGYVSSPRIQPEDAIGLVHQAGGLAVLAHPCKMDCDIHSLVNRLARAGLDGIEAFYPAATPGQRAAHVSLARQYGLLVSCGSDFHGGNRPGTLGDAWSDDPALEPIYDRLS